MTWPTANIEYGTCRENRGEVSEEISVKWLAIELIE